MNTKEMLDQAIKLMVEIDKVTEDEALTYLMNQNILNNTDAMQKFIQMKEVKKYLENIHIIEGDKPGQKDKRWKANVYRNDGTRTLLAAKSREELEQKIIQFCKSQKTVHSLLNLKDDYFKWRKGDVKDSTLCREKDVFAAYIEHASIAKKEMQKITIAELKEFCKETIDANNLSKKKYLALKSMLNGFWQFALENDYVSENRALCLKIAKNNFSKPKTFDKQKEIFSSEEEAILFKTAFDLYNKRKNLAYLTICLNFCLGLRIGELVALRKSDFDFKNNVIHVQRQEVHTFTTVGDSMVKDGFQITDDMKTEDSKRDIPITKCCKSIFDEIIKYHDEHGFTTDSLWVDKTGNPLHDGSLAKALRNANSAAGLDQRSMHKIRKTFLSRLNMSKLFTFEKIRELAGHSRESVVLYTNYFFDIDDIPGITWSSFDDIVDYNLPAIC